MSNQNMLKNTSKKDLLGESTNKHYLVIMFLILVVTIVGCTSNKTSLYCSENNTTCKSEAWDLLKKCNNSAITIEEPASTIRMEVNIQNSINCHLYYFIERASNPSVKGTSMTCDLPLSEANDFFSKGITPYSKYCEGSYKDLYVDTMSQFFG